MRNDKTIVYSAKGTGFKLRNLITEIVSDFSKSNNLGYTLAVRNIKARYRQSLLGLFWSFLPPIVTSVVWIILKSQGVVNFGGTEASYAVFIIIGTFLWQILTQSLLIPLQIMQTNQSILTKINFPREAIFFNALYEILFSYLLSLFVLISMVFAFQTPFVLNVFFFILISFLLLMMGLAVSLLLIPLSTLYKDVQFGMPSLMQLLLYLTPVIYPEPVYSGMAAILKYNPITPILNGARNVLLGSDIDISYVYFIYTFLILLFLIIGGLLLLRVTLSILIERMGS